MNPLYNDLSGKVVVLTGAGRGIGKAAAEAFARAGMHLVLVSQSESVYETAQEIKGISNIEIMPFQLDVADEKSVQRVFFETEKHFGKVDVLVNAAAILGPKGLLLENDAAEWIRAVSVNLGGTFLTMKYVLPMMREKGCGSIVNFSGGGAASPSPRFSAYGCSKAAVVRLTETVAEEVKDFGVRVNVIAPGANPTGMLKEFMDAGGEVRTFATLDQPVALLLYLASDRSKHVSGKFIHVNDQYGQFTEAGIKGNLYTLRRVEP